jgi:hypothetical protein
MKKTTALLVFCLLVSLLWVVTAQAGTTTKALQIRFNVTGGYKINKVMVYGPNQYGNWTRWTPPDSTGVQKSWINGVCDYATISVCPDNIFTTNYWWTGQSYVHFRVVHWYDTSSVKESTCQVNIPPSSWFDSISVTYDPEKGTCWVR